MKTWRFKAQRVHSCYAVFTRWGLVRFYPFWPFVDIMCVRKSTDTSRRVR